MNTVESKKETKNPAADLRDTAKAMIAKEELSKEDIDWLKDELDDLLETFGKYHSKGLDK